MNLILLIVVILPLFGGGGGYYAYNNWGPQGGIGIVGIVLIIIVVLFLFERGRSKPSFLLRDRLTATLLANPGPCVTGASG
jgi:Protein of unknown function (DUF3309)